MSGLDILQEFADAMRWHPLRCGGLDRFEVTWMLWAQFWREDAA